MVAKTFQSKALSTDLIASVLKKAKSRATKVAPKGTLWPDITDTIGIHDALMNGDNTVTLKGKVFNIKYRTQTHTIFISPVIGLTPCGEFNRETLEQEIASHAHS